MRFDPCRVADQGQHAAEVARAVKKIGIFGRRMSGAGKPLLKQRRSSREDKKRRADGDQKQQEYASDRVPLCGRRPLPRNSYRQDDACGNKDGQMNDDLTVYPGFRSGDMGISVTRKKHDLEKHHAGVPDSGRAAEEGEDHLCDHQLDKKKETCAQEKCERKQGGQ